ncbi:MAG: bacillithiol biosynthesis deacetylase BshB1 [Lutibacter sp.]|jgi:bacillithiol biosynthesis deacetylase BshB1|nr:bacillithiol biosynthesis deacetylase BshB1 [Lutibacter sp.]
MKVAILAIGAHPDDVELGCGATLAKEISLGKKVGILDLTAGELGTRGSAAIRAAEAEEAAAILGVSFRENLGFADGFFGNDKSHQISLIKHLRECRPEIVLCNAPEDRHPDHSKAAALVTEACFLSGLHKIQTTLDGKPQAAWRPKRVYHYIQWQPLSPDFALDVSGFMDTKLAAVKAYKSQFYDPDSKEPVSPISTKNFLDSVTYRAQDLGRLIGTEAAEGFVSGSYIAVSSLDKLL